MFIKYFKFIYIILPSFGVIVVGTGISCVALIFVLPGRPSNAGSKTKEELRFLKYMK